MNIAPTARIFVNPPGIVLLTVMVSFTFWVMPDFGILRKGFDYREEFLGPGLVIVTLWYAWIMLLSGGGYFLAKRIRWPHRRAERAIPLHDPWVYYALTAVSAFATAYLLFYLAQKLSLRGIYDLMSDSQANDIKAALYEEYTIGPLSLRYVAILSGGLALYRVLSGVGRNWMDLANFFFLIVTASVSSRLSIVAATAIGLTLYVIHTRRINLRLGWILSGILLFFLVLTFFNYTRNQHFYETRGNDNPLVAGASEIMAYLGSPFQGSLAVGNNLDNPSLLADPDFAGGIESGLTTNSALEELVGFYGLFFTFLLIGAISLVGGLTAGVLRAFGSTTLLIPYAVIMYGFAEIWRLFIFPKGIFIVLLFFSFSIPLGVFFLRYFSRRPPPTLDVEDEDDVPELPSV